MSMDIYRKNACLLQLILQEAFFVDKLTFTNNLVLCYNKPTTDNNLSTMPAKKKTSTSKADSKAAEEVKTKKTKTTAILSKQKKAVNKAKKDSGAKKKPLVIFDQKPGIKKVKVGSSILKIKTTGKKSHHVVNLKNPSYGFENEAGAELTTQIPKSQLPKPPARIVPKRTNQPGIDFASKKNLFSKTKTRLSNPFTPKVKIKKVKSKPITAKRKEEIEDVFSAPKEIEDIFATPEDKKILGLVIPKGWYKPLGVFAIVAFVLILPFQAFSYYQELVETKEKVLFLTNEAINDLKSAQDYAISFDLNLANEQFSQAKQNFALAQKEVNQVNFVTTEILKIIPGQGDAVQAGLTLLSGGEMLSEVGQILSQTGNEFLASQSGDYYQALVNLKIGLKSGLDKFIEAKALIESVSASDLPKNNQTAFLQVLQTLPIIKKGLIESYDLNSAILKILGEKQWQRYLVIFTNNNELRGSGGFMGTFALVDIDRGEIKDMEIPGGGTYDIQGQLVPKVISPAPLHLINTRWEFQDSNWWPNFPDTAQKIQWFYQNAGGPSTEGVILMTASLMEKLLEVVGPIEMPEYGDRIITSENFTLETQKIVELEYDREENRPKQFLAELAPKLLEKVFALQGENFKDLIAVLQKGLNEKHLLLYFSDPSVQDIVLNLDWGGKLKDTEGDFLSVVHANIAGGKTDAVVTEIINHIAEVESDGSIINTVELIRTHNGIRGEDIFTGVQNNSYVRFYVPLGSTLLEASGFEKPDEKYFENPSDELTADLDLISIETDRFTDEVSGTDIHKESGKTVFGNWLQINPGETKKAMVKYRLPFKIIDQSQDTFYYSLLAQKQTGSKGSKLFSQLILNDQLKPLTKYPTTLTESGGNIEYNNELIMDQFYGVTLIAK